MKMNFYGNLTCCGTHAMYSAYFQNWRYEDIMQFEAFTTVPFGVVNKIENPFRVFTCYCDPDEGIDRALQALEIPYRIHYQTEEGDSYQSLALMDEWLLYKPVVLGPLNMEYLTYILHSHLFECMDHFICVLGKEGEDYIISDSEGISISRINRSELIRAWEGDKIPEGRGKYIMRQVLIEEKPVFQKEQYKRIFPMFIENMKQCEELPNGGSNGLHTIMKHSGKIMEDVNLQRRMCFDIPVRMQRCVIMNNCLAIMNDVFQDSRIQEECRGVSRMLKQQLEGYTTSLGKLRKRDTDAFESFGKIADIEHKISGKLAGIGECLL